MNYRSNVIDRRAIIDEVLPEHKKISEAPSRVEDLPGYSAEFTPEERDSFRLVAMAQERRRRYKSVDLEGNIYLVGNPWARVIETRQDGTCWVLYPKPLKIFTYAEAKQEAARLAESQSKEASHSRAKKPADDFDY